MGNSANLGLEESKCQVIPLSQLNSLLQELLRTALFCVSAFRNDHLTKHGLGIQNHNITRP